MKYFILAFFGLALALSSCKKEGCTDLDATNFDGTAKKDDGSCTYEVAPVVIDTICDGLPGDNTYWPLFSGLFRKYSQTIYGLPSNTVFDVTEQVLGQVNLSGVYWYEVKITSYMIPGSPSESTEYFRKNQLNGNMYRKSGTTEILVMPGTPALGQEIDGFFITDLNASKSTGECNYTGCLKATKDNGTDTEILWFKRGIGQVYYDGPLGNTELTEIQDF